MQLLIKFIYSRLYIFTLKLMVEKLTKDMIHKIILQIKEEENQKKMKLKYSTLC